MKSIAVHVHSIFLFLFLVADQRWRHLNSSQPVQGTTDLWQKGETVFLSPHHIKWPNEKWKNILFDIDSSCTVGCTIELKWVSRFYWSIKSFNSNQSLTIHFFKPTFDLLFIWKLILFSLYVLYWCKKNSKFRDYTRVVRKLLRHLHLLPWEKR